MGTPSYSARFVQPFAEVLARCESYDPRALARLRALDPSGRMPIDMAHDLVLEQVRQSNDEDLGIKAARLVALGRGGALDYAMNTAPTVRKAIEFGARYSRMYSDSLRVLLDIRGSRAFVRLGTTHPAPRAVPDFAMGIWYQNFTRTPLGESPRIECSFEHATPAHKEAYDGLYGSAELRFNAPFYGVSFEREYLDAPLQTADPETHALLCAHVALAASRLEDHVDMTHRVRELVLHDLLDGTPTLATAASQLRMSPRTLGKLLEREGTTFSRILDELRRDLALEYLAGSDVSHSEIAFRLGFAHVEAFYRAFKRWTGVSPLGYRKALPAVGRPLRAGN
jgi:AraC-like DNA-binding protein